MFVQKSDAPRQHTSRRLYRWLPMLLVLVSAQATACTLTMAYQPRSKAPFIAATPDNDGIYLRLYSQAAERIGCTVDIRRLPKKRITALMRSGGVDFYPGFKFSPKRMQYAQFLPNGLVTGRIGLSRPDMADVSDIEQLNGRHVIMSLGGVDYARRASGANVTEIANLDVPRAVRMLRAGRTDFYATDPTEIRYYLNKAKVTDLRVHPRCCGGVQPMYAGFSRHSRHFADEPNPRYDPAQAASPLNAPTRVDTASIAGRLADSLRQMLEDGSTEQVVDAYLSGSDTQPLPD